VTWVPVPEGTDFTAANLPYGIGRSADGSTRAVVALGDHAIDLDRAQQPDCSMPRPPECSRPRR
jgi:fumarylacetoacetase